MSETSEIVEKVLEENSYWSKPVPQSIARDIASLKLSLVPDLVSVIQGVRRCGKSTLLGQIMQEKKLNPKACYFINFEDPRLSNILDTDLLDMIVTIAERRTGLSDLKYFFFDEIQNLKGWEKWLRSKVDRPGKNHFIITGSNAAMLSGDLGTVLTGRHQTIELFPFSFSEYRKVHPEKSFENYLEEGGFPRTLTFEHPQELLRQYFTDIIERDVRRHVAVRSPLTLVQLAKAVFDSAGSEVSQRTLAEVLGSTADTIGAYLDACTRAYLILPCHFFSYSERKRIVRNRKFYPIDLGLKNSVITRGGKDLGKNLETIVFYKLRKSYKEVYYWRGKGEVDFIVQDGSTVRPFQVSWDGPKDRHQRANEEFRLEFPKAEKVEFISRANVEHFLNGRGF